MVKHIPSERAEDTSAGLTKEATAPGATRGSCPSALRDGGDSSSIILRNEGGSGPVCGVAGCSVRVVGGDACSCAVALKDVIHSSVIASWGVDSMLAAESSLGNARGVADGSAAPVLQGQALATLTCACSGLWCCRVEECGGLVWSHCRAPLAAREATAQLHYGEGTVPVALRVRAPAKSQLSARPVATEARLPSREYTWPHWRPPQMAVFNNSGGTQPARSRDALWYATRYGNGRFPEDHQS
jgi:hypothetical protein